METGRTDHPMQLGPPRRPELVGKLRLLPLVLERVRRLFHDGEITEEARPVFHGQARIMGDVVPTVGEAEGQIEGALHVFDVRQGGRCGQMIEAGSGLFGRGAHVMAGAKGIHRGGGYGRG